MDSKIIEDKKNPLFNRREVKIIVQGEKTPTFAEAEKIITEVFKTPAENIKIIEIQGKFGRDTFLISSNIYSTIEDKQKIEPKQKEKKAKGK